MEINIFDLVVVSLITLANLFLALLVYLKNKRARANISFSFFALLSTLWIISAFCSDLVTSHNARIILSKLAYFFVIWTLFALINFSREFVGYKERFWNNIIIVISSSILSFLILSTSKIIYGIEETIWGFSLLQGPWSLFFSIHIAVSLLYLAYIIIFSYRLLQGYTKTQVRYLFFGIFLSALSAFVFNIVLRSLLNSDIYYKYGNYSLILFTFFTAYSIVKHRLMDIRMVVARSVTYALLLVTILGIAGVFMTLLPTYLLSEAIMEEYGIPIRATMGVVLALLFQPLRRWFTRVTDKIFFKNDYDSQSVLKQTIATANATLTLIDLLYKTMDIVIKEVKVTRGMFVLLDEKGSVFTSQAIHYKVFPKLDSKEIMSIAKKEEVSFDVLTEGTTKRVMRKFDASLALGMFDDAGRPLGVLFLGEKESGDMYNAKDMNLFGILIPELSIAIHRAKEHEKIAQFNIVLQQEVARQTKELVDKNEKLKELDKAKDEFISMASHQLRTPLTAIKGYLSMLLEGDAGEIKMAQYDFVTEAYNGASRMVGLINDLLNVSRMETGRFFIEPVEVDFEKMVDEEMRQLKNHAKDKGLYLKLDKKKNKLPKVRADETKLRQVVMNFIDNAIYYTQNGGVTVVLDANSRTLTFKVVDTGIGVPEAAKKELFTKFYRAENARRARPDGTGLGIYLAKKVMRDHHGEVIFDSIEGKGSTFGFTMPLKQSFSRDLTTPPPDLAVKSEYKNAEEATANKAAAEGNSKKEKSSALF